MTPARLAALLIVVSFVFLAVAFLTGCSNLGISLETDYGRLTYTLPELPMPTSSK